MLLVVVSVEVCTAEIATPRFESRKSKSHKQISDLSAAWSEHLLGSVRFQCIVEM